MTDHGKTVPELATMLDEVTTSGVTSKKRGPRQVGAIDGVGTGVAHRGVAG